MTGSLRSPRTLRLAAGVLLAAVVAAGFVVDLHPHFAIERLPAFHAGLGLLACAGLVAGARLLAALVGREEGGDGR